MMSLGPLGATSSGDMARASELEKLGYDTIWLPGGGRNTLPQVADVLRATSRVTVATGILAVDLVPAAELVRAYTTLARSHPGRFLPGLGGAHGPNPLATLGAYFDELDPVVPASQRILAALGPKMLKLARDRASAAYPFLVTPEYVASARELLGPGKQLPVGVSVFAEPDPARARATIRNGSLRFLSGVPAYPANFRRMGFTAEEVAGLADRLVDGVTVWGDFDTVVARLREYRAAGADQLVLAVDDLPRQWQTGLAEALR